MTPALDVRTYLLGQRREWPAHADRTNAFGAVAPIGFSLVAVDGAKSAHGP